MRPGPKAFVGLLLAAALTGCEDPCSSDLIASAPAANGVVARLEKKNCGATTGYVYEVKALDRDGGSQTVLRFDNDHNPDWPDDDKALLDMRWVGGSQLVLDVHVPARVFKKKAKLNGVPVRYRFAPGSNGI